MGSGAFGSNGSVYWQVMYDDNATTPFGSGRDATKKHPGKPDVPGQPDTRPVIGGGQKDHPGQFRIVARFPGTAAAEAALKSLNDAFKVGKTELVLDVDLRSFQDTPGPANRWEITIDW